MKNVWKRPDTDNSQFETYRLRLTCYEYDMFFVFALAFAVCSHKMLNNILPRCRPGLQPSVSHLPWPVLSCVHEIPRCKSSQLLYGNLSKQKSAERRKETKKYAHSHIRADGRTHSHDRENEQERSGVSDEKHTHARRLASSNYSSVEHEQRVDVLWPNIWRVWFASASEN